MDKNFKRFKKIDELIAVGTDAKNKNRYLVVVIEAPDLVSPELILNPPENIIDKLIYYKKAYTDDLELKVNNKIRIIDFMQYDIKTSTTFYCK